MRASKEARFFLDVFYKIVMGIVMDCFLGVAPLEGYRVPTSFHLLFKPFRLGMSARFSAFPRISSVVIVIQAFQAWHVRCLIFRV